VEVEIQAAIQSKDDAYTVRDCPSTILSYKVVVVIVVVVATVVASNNNSSY
jgi:SUMO ligase MMS21 Smc5/6 complex component